MFDFNLLNFENKEKPVATGMSFAWRLIRNVAYSLVLVVFSLAVGMWGYHYFEDLGLVDSFVNAAMILSGMGPISLLIHDGSKIFAGVYALYSGFLAITITAFLLAPVAHRVLHSFHAELESDEEGEEKTKK